jgi:hypothetical protein
MIQRAKDANCSALVLTLDLQVIGQRHKDLKNGLTAPPKPTLANIINLMTKPRWCLGMAGTRRHTFRNLVGHVKGVADMSSLSAWTATQFDPTLNWNDVEWIKKRWGGKLILKGIMDVEDARLAASTMPLRARLAAVLADEAASATLAPWLELLAPLLAEQDGTTLAAAALALLGAPLEVTEPEIGAEPPPRRERPGGYQGRPYPGRPAPGRPYRGGGPPPRDDRDRDRGAPRRPPAGGGGGGKKFSGPGGSAGSRDTATRRRER